MTIPSRLLEILNCDFEAAVGFKCIYFEVISRELMIYDRKAIYGTHYFLCSINTAWFSGNCYFMMHF